MKIHHWFIAIVLFTGLFAAVPDNYFVWSTAAWDDPLPDVEQQQERSASRSMHMQEQVRFPATQGSLLLGAERPPIEARGATNVPPWPVLRLDDAILIGVNDGDTD